MATIERGDAHIADAGDWPEAYQMGVFLLWAARHGIAAPDHVEQLTRLAAAPAAYVVNACDGKLLPGDFAAGETVIRHVYERFLADFCDVVVSEASRADFVGLDPELLASIDRFLDREAQRFAPELIAGDAAVAGGQRVRHAKFGLGVLVAESREDGTVTVEFDEVGRKLLVARFVEPVTE